MTNEVVDLEKRDYDDEESEKVTSEYENPEDQIQDDARTKLAFIADTVNEIVIGLRNSGIFEGMALDYTQIRMNWENDSVSMFKALIAGDRLSLDEALMVTLDYLNDAELDIRANPNNINKDLVNKNELKQEEFKENLIQTFEANRESRLKRIEEKNAARNLKNKNFKRENKFNGPLANRIDMLAKVIDIQKFNDFLKSNNYSIEGILENKDITQYLSNTLGIEGDFKDLNIVERYEMIKSTYLVLSCGEKNEEFRNAVAEIIKARLNQLPDGIFKDGNFGDLLDLKKALDVYHKEMYEMGEVEEPNFQYDLEMANFRANSDITFNQDNMFSSLEDAEYEALAFKQHMQIASEYGKLITRKNADAIEMSIFVSEITKDDMVPGFLDFLCTLDPKNELKRREKTGCIEIGENGLASENPKTAKVRNDLDHAFFERYKREKEIDEREHRRGINKFADEYTNEKCRLVMRNRIVREVVTKGCVDPAVLNEMIETNPSIVRSAIIDLIKDGRGEVSLWEGNSDGTLPIKLENIISDPKQLQRIIIAPPAEMVSAIEIDRVNMSRDEEKDYLAEQLKSISPNQLGTRANYSAKKQEIEDKLNPDKNEEAFRKMREEYNEVMKTRDKVSLLEFAKRNRKTFERVYSAVVLNNSSAHLTVGDTNFANVMTREFGVLDMLDKSQEAVEDPRKLNRLDTLLKKEVGVRPQNVGELLMLSVDERFKDDPRFDYVRTYAKKNAKTYAGIINSPLSDSEKREAFSNMAKGNPGRLFAAGMYVRELINQGRQDELGLTTRDASMVDSLVSDATTAFSKQETEQMHVGFMIEKLSNYKSGAMDYNNFLLQFSHYTDSEIGTFKRLLGSGKYEKLTEKEATDISCVNYLNRMVFSNKTDQGNALESLKNADRDSIVTATTVLFARQKLTINSDEKVAALENISQIDPKILPKVQKNLVDMHNANPNAKNILQIMSTIQDIIDRQKGMGVDFQTESADVLQESKADYHKIVDSGSDGKISLFEHREDDDTGR